MFQSSNDSTSQDFLILMLQGFKVEDFKVPGFHDSKVQGFKVEDFKIPGFHGSKVLKFKVLRIQGSAV